jgi:predicted nicotinamide N-methyase
MDGLHVVELGCGLGLPSLVAAARGAGVTALDWAVPAIDLLRENAARNGLALDARHGDWRAFTGSFELVLGSDLLYEERNADALLALLPALAPEVLLAEPGRPYSAEFLARAGAEWRIEVMPDRVYRLTRAIPAGSPAGADG